MTCSTHALIDDHSPRTCRTGLPASQSTRRRLRRRGPGPASGPRDARRPGRTVPRVTTPPAPTLAEVEAALHRSQDRLAAAVAVLAPAELTGPSYDAGWTVADVLSHLGSGAAIADLSLEAGAGSSRRAGVRGARRDLDRLERQAAAGPGGGRRRRQRRVPGPAGRSRRRAARGVRRRHVQRPPGPAGAAAAAAQRARRAHLGRPGGPRPRRPADPRRHRRAAVRPARAGLPRRPAQRGAAAGGRHRRPSRAPPSSSRPTATDRGCCPARHRTCPHG